MIRASARGQFLVYGFAVIAARICAVCCAIYAVRCRLLHHHNVRSM